MPKRTKKPVKRKNEPNKALLGATWIGGIPQSTAHGSGIIQRKLWRVVSDRVRITDWYQFKGKCISCDRYIFHWREGQAAHFRAFSVCRGYSKFDTKNIFLSCAYCNTGFDANIVGVRMADGIITRYGVERLEELENFTNRPLDKMEEPVLIGLIREHIIKMEFLPEKPDYVEEAIRKIKEEDATIGI